MPNQFTVTDILKNKEKYELKEDVKVKLLINRLDSTITVKKPDRSICVEAIAMTQDANLADSADKFMLYNIIVEPDLKDKKLQEAFGCKEPYDIVDKLFEPGEIPSIAQKGMELAGYSNELTVVDDLKN